MLHQWRVIYMQFCSLIFIYNFYPQSLATAFASASTFFNHLAQSKAGNQEDSKYADILLVHATQLYNASHSILPYSRYQSSVPTVVDAYASTGKYIYFTSWSACSLIYIH